MLVTGTMVKVCSNPKGYVGKKLVGAHGIVAGIFAVDKETLQTTSYIVYFYELGITAQVYTTDLETTEGTWRSKMVKLLMKMSTLFTRSKH